MSIRVMTSVWTHSIQKGSNLLILLALADTANDDGYAWPSVDKLAQKGRLTRRATQKILRSLEQEGELAILTGSGPNKTNLYRVTTPEIGPAVPVRTGGEKFSPPSFPDKGGERNDTLGVSHRSPKPSVEPSVEPSTLPPTVPHEGMKDLRLLHFDRFWSAYPRKEKKPEAEKAYLRATANAGFPGIERVLVAIEEQRRSDKWTRESGRFIPLPATWLNNDCWNDVLSAPPPPKLTPNLPGDPNPFDRWLPVPLPGAMVWQKCGEDYGKLRRGQKVLWGKAKGGLDGFDDVPGWLL